MSYSNACWDTRRGRSWSLLRLLSTVKLHQACLWHGPCWCRLGKGLTGGEARSTRRLLYGMRLLSERRCQEAWLQASLPRNRGTRSYTRYTTSPGAGFLSRLAWLASKVRKAAMIRHPTGTANQGNNIILIAASSIDNCHTCQHS